MASPRRTVLWLVVLFLTAAVSLHAQRTDLPDSSMTAPALPDGGVGLEDEEPYVPALSYVEETGAVHLDSTQLAVGPTTLAETLVRSGTMGDNYCNDLSIHSGAFWIKLDLGDDYNYAETSFTVDLSMKILGVNTDPAIDDTVLTHDPILLSIDEAEPEEKYYIEYAGTDLDNHDSVDEYRLYVNSFSVTGPVGGVVLVTLGYDDEYAIDPRRPSPDENLPIVLPQPVGGSLTAVHTANPIHLGWFIDESCADRFPAYQVQIMRVFNTLAAYKDDPAKVHAVVDWSQALTVDVDGTSAYAQELKMTLAQGTGWYLWRVRPIGSIYPGGAGDARNWGVWSDAPADDSVIDATNLHGLSGSFFDTCFFYYASFEDTLNWVHARAWTEDAEGTGSRVSEAMTFFTPAGRPAQSQMRSVEEGSYQVTNGVVDFQGQATVSAMSTPVPAAGQGFAFRENIFTRNSEPYQAKHFDHDTNYQDTDPTWGGILDDYWDGVDLDPYAVPSAEHFPFSRVLLSTDGSGRPREIGGVGATHRIGAVIGGKDRTTKIRYASASESELIRLFGDEAPIDTNVYKVMVTGPNKTTAVSWVHGGRTIATAMEVEQLDTLLLGIDGDTTESRLTGTNHDTLRAGRERAGGTAFTASKRYSFTDTTDLTIRYTLTPDEVTASALCIDTCVTCDYLVRLYIHTIDNDDPFTVFSQDFIWAEGGVAFEQRLGGDPCGEAAAIDTSFVVTLDPGTYIIERRIETGTVDPATIDSVHPYGRTFLDGLKRTIAGGIREQVMADDSIAVIMGLLGANDLDSLYRYLDVPLDSVAVGDTITITTECCEITFPVIAPSCGFDPCRDSVPDFESYLFGTWGAEYDSTDLNVYFQFDGTEDVWESGAPSHPFNTLVANMLADTNALGEPLYDCATLWGIWSGLVNGWERLQDDPDGSGFNPDFNLLDMFLSAAGRHIVDTSHTPYNATNGYLLWAHRYVRDEVLDNADCNDHVDYHTGWHGDVDSSDRWMELYSCWSGSERENRNDDLEEFGDGCTDPNPDSCRVRNARVLEDQCRSRCEDRRGEFAWGIVRAYEADGQTICFDDALCMADAIVDSCAGGCELTVLDVTSPVDSIGTQAQWEAMRIVMTSTVEYAVPMDTGAGQFCANDTMTLYEGLTRPLNEVLVEALNQRIDEWVRTDGGTLFNVKAALRYCTPDSVLSALTDSLIFLPTLAMYDDSSYVRPYFELRGGGSCELWYVSDTIFWSKLRPGVTHPLVLNLNNYLEQLWGMPVDSSVAMKAGTADTVVTDTVGTYRIRQYDYLENMGGVYATLLDYPVNFVNGSLNVQQIDQILTFGTLNEYGLFVDNEATGHLYGQTTIQRAGSSDFVGITTRHRTAGTDSGYIDLLYTFKSAGCDSLFGFTRAYNAHLPSGITLPAPITNISISDDAYVGSGSLQGGLSLPFEVVFGEFIHASGDSLFCRIDDWDHPGSGITCPALDVRFYALPTLRLATDVCDTKPCPDICWRWVDHTVDTGDAVTVAPPPCEEVAARRMRGAIESSLAACITDALDSIDAEYGSKCANPENFDEQILIDYDVDYIHFSLYYYDRAGRLVRTVPPKGVNVLGDTATRLDATSHDFISEYDYNSLGQVIRTQTPDGGETRFWYDRVGRLRFAQDARLAALGQYAYTRYDSLGRTVESGVSSDSIAGDEFADDVNINDLWFPAIGSERTFIVYESPVITYLDGSPQRNLRNRVSMLANDESSQTYYSYDIHGNVEWVAQVTIGFPLINFLKYDYDLISGNVNEVVYNEGRVDEFRHRYTYDADNALTQVETSYDGVIWDSDARYHYYSHGALKRIELGEDKVQGLDLTYTIHGQLKAINHRLLDQTIDPGKDGSGNPYAADSFAVVMNYHAKDWDGDNAFESGDPDDLLGDPLYDGNISGMEVVVGKTTGVGQNEELTGETYRYDVLGRLDSSRFHTYNDTTDAWRPFGQEYLTSYDYDANGNITRLVRHANDTGVSTNTRLDSLLYHYQSPTSNKLDWVQEGVAGDPVVEDISNTQSATNYEYDPIGNLIEDLDEGGMSMTWDASGRVRTIDRTTVGGATQNIEYDYDPGGNRTRQIITSTTGVPGVLEIETTYYVHDAAGTVVAIYEEECEIQPPVMPGAGDADGDGVADSVDNCPCVMNPTQQDPDMDGVGSECDDNPAVPGPPKVDADGDGTDDEHDNCICVFNPDQKDSDNDGRGDSCDAGCDFRLVELPIYGLGRVGVARPDISIYESPDNDSTYSRPLDLKFYELTDHLGNVRAVLGDRKLTATPGAGNYYGNILSYQHQYPYGMPQPGRAWDNSVGYRYGYNGMETDPEVKGSAGSHYTTYFRQYDSRLGRWWSNDPVTHSWESPYAAMNGNPVLFNDPLGDCPTCPKDVENYESGDKVKDAYGWEYTLTQDENGTKSWAYELEGVVVTGTRRGSNEIHSSYPAYVVTDYSLDMNGRITREQKVIGSIEGLSRSDIGYVNRFFFQDPHGKWRDVSWALTSMKTYPGKNHPDKILNIIYEFGYGNGTIEVVRPDLSPILHTALDFLGLVPLLGEVFDGINALLYFASGDMANGMLSAAAMVPFFGWGANGIKIAKMFLTSGKWVKVTRRYGNDIKEIVGATGRVGREVITLTKSGLRADALKVAKSMAGDLGSDQIPNMGSVAAQTNRVTGLRSLGGERGWRIDYDAQKGAHYHYWNNGVEGVVPFEGTLETVEELINQLTKTYQ